MAIQIPNVGTGVPADQTGDSPWLAMQKVAENFSNSSHAASRLVGTGSGNLLEYNDNLLNTVLSQTVMNNTNQDTGVSNVPNGLSFYSAGVGNRTPLAGANLLKIKGYNKTSIQFAFGYKSTDYGKLYTRSQFENDEPATEWVAFYTQRNTTVDGNGFIKAASPIVQVYADKIELNDDAKQQGVTFTKNGIGDYTISDTSGLSTDGWYLELPKDLNGNPKVAITLTETDGIIELKCYKRIFSMETFTFEPDLDSPVDVPDGRWIDIRLNEIEHEAPTMPDVDLDKKD